VKALERLLARPWVAKLLHWRYLKFAVVGASGALVNVGVLYLGQEWVFAGIAPAPARLDCSLAAAILLATVNNFLWNRLWTWHDRSPSRAIPWQFARYALACWLAIVLQFLLTRTMAGAIPYLIANVIAILCASACNFLVHDFWTFGARRAGIPPVRTEG
jgi:dolichol-phosphate mannosyltransferase